jgi:DNA helicase HerA-like ATPase
LLDKIEQVTRLIRSKGVGVYYITQNPLDVPDTVSSQLGNRIQHALRAFTPREQKAVKAAATTFRPNPEIDTERTIMELEKGEALVSVLEGKGAPSIVQRTLMRPPSGRLGPVTPEERKAVIQASPVMGQYEKTIDRESAHEMLEKRAKGVETRRKEAGGTLGGRRDVEYERHGEFKVPKIPRGDTEAYEQDRAGTRGGRRTSSGSTSRRQSAGEAFSKSLLRSLGTAIGSAIGSILRGRR